MIIAILARRIYLELCDDILEYYFFVAKQYPDINLVSSKKYGFLFSYSKDENIDNAARSACPPPQFILVKEENEKFLYATLDLVCVFR
ncbi:hypothetical protein DI09_20p250 [Mitosporidium daphniae]|uniref:Uncharacterized protein n=1 Tax=Mitosporidium daphniae TaxID=1485682 RepID=A0A098VSP2_9MICR|nr:uncharacterized protein DI09_20p250 [Mitosporidium daphniae]KGG52108.1 hypothetical protein DI09_20p250 [Mitosporidium daphniae]|eukprot:XP_013238535.1 uncharacterized protein DI09_20p250 [Mitosporidium daphniae]